VAGVRVVIEGGQVVSCTSQLESNPDVHATGSAVEWFLAVRDGNGARLRHDGSRLAEILIKGLHAALRPG
jgi:hypothetical protein